MPYIRPDLRPAIDELVEPLIDHLAAADDGSVNYAITRLLHGVYARELRYERINRAMGVLACVEAEFYRRVAAPYEDQKIAENGDVV
jgi:Domain of unknown function (DUF6899)